MCSPMIEVNPMSGLEPVWSAHKTECKQCGTGVADRETAEITAEYGGGVEVAAPSCCDACAKAYRAREREDIEQFEEVFRAGAT